MMHELNQHLMRSLAERLEKRRVVTWYDSRCEFTTFIAELAGGVVPEKCQIDSVEVAGKSTNLCVMQESFFEVKFATETCVTGDISDPVLIYIPGKERHDDSSILMELEVGGDRWEPQLKREARRVLKKRFGDGQIDQMLSSPNVSYQDIVGLLEDGGNSSAAGSLLEVIYSQVKGSNAVLIAAWLAGSDHDTTIDDKGAKPELFQLLQSRLGLELQPETDLEDARKKVCRYVLLGEFRKDLSGDPPASLDMVSQPTTKQLEVVLEVTRALRETHPAVYVALSDEIEQDLHLESLDITPESLGSIDTFRFEEQVLLEHVGNLIIAGKFIDAIEVVQHRRTSFWALHQLERQEQWQAYGLAAQLGRAVSEVNKQLPDPQKTVVHWVEGYIAENGWYLIDCLHRQLESMLAAMTDTIASEKVIHRVRNDYESLVGRMTTGFISAFKEAGWSIPGVLHQTEIYSKEVHSPSEVTCFILTDALRYEMGVELMGLLENAEQLSIQPAVGSIPTITPIGMAALMPGAEASFSVVECNKDIGAKIDTSVTGSLHDRRKVWKGKVPGVVDLDLDKVLSHSNSQLEKKISGSLLIVRSVEIDAMGEGGNTFLARQVMDTAINNVARGIKRLAGLGISRFIVAADHGHLFIHERDESERIEKPGGDQIALHRRCWAGRGGSTPPSTIRISGSQLSYDSDLDFVFPTNNSVFKAGGDLAYYHGGLSLQELLVPVISVRMPTKIVTNASKIQISLTKLPEKIVNRIVTFGVAVDSAMFTDERVVSVRPVLLHNGRHVGHVGMVLNAEHDTSTQNVKIEQGKTCTVGIQLLRDDIDNVEILVLDPDTDQILTKSNKIPIKL